MGARRVGGPEGWGPDQKKVRVPRVGAQRVGPEGGWPKISLFFFFSLSGVFSCNFGGVSSGCLAEGMSEAGSGGGGSCGGGGPARGRGPAEEMKKSKNLSI